MLLRVLNMSKMTFKLLSRNKGYWFFAIILPILATLILNVSNSSTETETIGDIIEISANDRMAYLESVEKFHIKFYDCSNSDESLILCDRIVSTGLFQIFRVNACDMSYQEIIKSAKDSAMHDKVDGIIVINSDFSEEIKNGNISTSVEVYKTGDDDRYKMFSDSLTSILKSMEMEAYNNEIYNSNSIDKTIVVEGIEKTNNESFIDLDCSQSRLSVFGNVVALYSATFLFAGLMILGTIMTEKNNLVFTRIQLSQASEVDYILSKFVIVILGACLQTFIAVLTFTNFVKADIGFSTFQFSLLLFSLALIFNLLSVCLGSFCKNVLSASLMSFTVWMISSILAGIYFDISNASEIYKRVALIMPQRWTLLTASMFVSNNSAAYPVLIVDSLTYIIVILLIGAVGLRLSKRE